MKDEIKEILSLLKSSSWCNEAEQIEDYITNLQEENEMMMKLINEGVENSYKKIKEYEKRINKAIEYCKLNKEFTPRLVDIENILQGEDKDGND